MNPSDDYKDTLLAHRLQPGSHEEPTVRSPAALVAGAVLIVLAVVGGCTSINAGLILLFFALLAFAYALGCRDVPNLPEPMPEGHVGHQVASGLLRVSRSALERAHVFLGWVYGTDRRVPVLIHKLLLNVHFLIVGATNAAKSTRALLPALVQLLWGGDCVVILFDLKGSSESGGNASLSILRETAERLRIPFYFFTDVRERACHLWRLLDNSACAGMSDNQLTQSYCSATGLEHGEDYGKSFFAAMAEMFVKCLVRLLRSSGRALTPARLLRLASDHQVRNALGMSRREQEAVIQVIPTLDRLADDPRLNMTADHAIAPSLLEHAITPDKAIRGPAVFYFELHAQLEPTTVRVLPRLFLKQLIAELITWKGPRVEQIYFVVDEAGETLQRGWMTNLKQARSLKLSIGLVCQNLSDLKRDDADFTDAVLGNTAVKVFMSAKDERARQYLEKTGGDKIVQMLAELTSTTESDHGTATSEGRSQRDTVVPVYNANTVNEILNAHSEFAIVDASPTSGFTSFKGPILIEMPYSMSEEEFKEHDRCPWPEPDGIRTVRASDLPPDPSAPAPAPAPEPPPAAPPTGGKRRRPPKPVDPDELRRAEALAETLRQMRGEL